NRCSTPGNNPIHCFDFDDSTGRFAENILCHCAHYDCPGNPVGGEIFTGPPGPHPCGAWACPWNWAGDLFSGQGFMAVARSRVRNEAQLKNVFVLEGGWEEWLRTNRRNLKWLNR